MLIDYEAGMWNPLYHDVANYLNEWVCDNTQIAYFMENWPSNPEITALTREYFLLLKQREHGDCPRSEVEGLWSLELEACVSAVAQVKQCMLLNNFSNALWAILVLSEEDETNDRAFHWEFLRGRCLMIKTCFELFGIAKIV